MLSGQKTPLSGWNTVQEACKWKLDCNHGPPNNVRVQLFRMNNVREEVIIEDKNSSCLYLGSTEWPARIQSRCRYSVPFLYNTYIGFAPSVDLQQKSSVISSGIL